jgi:hypothetical protein
VLPFTTKKSLETPMEKELLEMAAEWKETAQEMIQKSANGSRSEMMNQMLYACAEMLEWVVKSASPRSHSE